MISVDPQGGPRTTQVDLLPTAISDLIVCSYGEYFYRIERYKSDSIAKFHVSQPAAPVYQYSTLNSTDQITNNPHDLIFASATKAYMPMYSSDSNVWVVNPSATSQEEFRTGFLDISPYLDSDGIAEAHQGVVVGNRVFILISRLNRDDGWNPTNTAYVAVFDVTTGEEINTGKDNRRGHQRHPLALQKPRHRDLPARVEQAVHLLRGQVPHRGITTPIGTPVAS